MKSDLEELEEAIREAKGERKKSERRASLPFKALNMALEMIVATGVGCFLGYQLDKFTDTLPLFFILGFFLGVAAGALTLYKRATKFQTEGSEEREQ